MDKDTKFIKANCSIGSFGMFFTFETEDHTSFTANDFTDEMLINILKQKGYKITKEF